MNAIKTKLLTCLILLLPVLALSQNTGISDVTHAPASSAVLDVYSTTKGMLTPRMMQSERLAIVSPATGLLVYQTDGLAGFYYYNGTAWTTLASGYGTQWATIGSSISYNWGAVGIGTSAPASYLHVKSTTPTTGGVSVAKFEGLQNTGSMSNFVFTQLSNSSASNSKTGFIFGGSSLSKMWVLGNDYFATNTQNCYLFDYNTLSVRFFIDAAGNTGIGSTAPNSLLHVSGSFSLPVTTPAVNYTATASDHTILCNAGSMTVTLPAAAGITGRMYVIKKVSAAAGTITIDPNGTETIDGSLTNTSITLNYQSITIQSDGSNWYILSKN